jgi:hypothetical protein
MVLDQDHDIEEVPCKHRGYTFAPGVGFEPAVSGLGIRCRCCDLRLCGPAASPLPTSMTHPQRRPSIGSKRRGNGMLPYSSGAQYSWSRPPTVTVTQAVSGMPYSSKASCMAVGFVPHPSMVPKMSPM